MNIKYTAKDHEMTPEKKYNNRSIGDNTSAMRFVDPVSRINILQWFQGYKVNWVYTSNCRMSPACKKKVNIALY